MPLLEAVLRHETKIEKPIRRDLMYCKRSAQAADKIRENPSSRLSIRGVYQAPCSRSRRFLRVELAWRVR